MQIFGHSQKLLRGRCFLKSMELTLQSFHCHNFVWSLH